MSDERKADSTHESLNSEVETTAEKPTRGAPQPMQIKRFLSGTLIAATGLTIMLAVAMGALQNWGVGDQFSIPAIALSMILGLMMLGGGFGVMATSAGTFDDDEFERLMAGERRAVDVEESAPIARPEIIEVDERSPASAPPETTSAMLAC